MLNPGVMRLIPGVRYSRDRRLSPDAEILVRLGQMVRPETPIARLAASAPSVNVPAGSLLGVQGEGLAQCLVKQVGDDVKEGDLLAKKGGLIGGKREVFAPAAGIIDMILYDTGEIVIARSRQIQISTAETIGRVTQIVPGERVTIETPAAIVECILGLGQPVSGILRIAVGSPSEELSEEKVSGDCRDSVLVGGVVARDQVLHLARKMGAVGIIAGGAPAARHESWLSAQPAIPLSLALTEGFGAASMHQSVFDLLGALAGAPVLIRPLPNGRARIVIMLREETELKPSPPPVLAIGSSVRIVRNPHFGAAGRIVEIPTSPQRLPSGVVTEVARVDLADHSRVVVPVANLELIG